MMMMKTMKKKQKSTLNHSAKKSQLNDVVFCVDV
jgi:hypothetical protein